MTSRTPGRPEDTAIDWDRVYAEYGPALRNAIRGTMSAHDVDDVLQDTFLRLERVRSRGRLDTSTPMWPLLVTLARRASIDHWRVVRRREVVGLAATGATEGADLAGAGAGGEFDAVERSPSSRSSAYESIVAAIRTLDARDRRLLVRCVLEEAPRAEVAAEEGLSASALRLALTRARRRFRAAYAEYSDEMMSAILVSAWWVRARQKATTVVGAAREAEVVARVGLALSAAAAVTLVLGAQQPPAGDSTAVLASHPALPIGKAGEPGRFELRSGGPDSAPRRARTSLTAVPEAVSSAPVGVPAVRGTTTTIDVGPERSRVGIYIEWTDPAGNGHGSAAIEFQCSGGVVATTFCPPLRGVPATSEGPQ